MICTSTLLSSRRIRRGDECIATAKKAGAQNYNICKEAGGE
jgi:hypothetical protein